MLSLCKTEIDVLKFSIHFWGTSSISVPQLWRDSLLFKGLLVLLSFNISNIPKSRRTSWSQHDAFIVQDSESMYWNSVSTFGALLQFQYHSCEEIVYFSRDFSTTFIHISNIPKSRRTSWSQTDAFIVQDWNRCTEIQYPLLGHFFNFSTTAVKR